MRHCATDKVVVILRKKAKMHCHDPSFENNKV